MQLRKHLLLLPLLWSCSLLVCAQPKVVNVSARLNTISSTEAEIIFDATIENGWHMYSTEVVEYGPTPTSFTAEKLNGCKLNGDLRATSKEIKKYEAAFDTEVSYFELKAQFVQKLSITSSDFGVEGYLRYGACNDMNCTPPTTYEVNLKGKAPVAEKAVKEEPVAEPLAEEEPQAEAADTTSDAEEQTSLATSDWWTPVTDEIKQTGSDAAVTTSDSLWTIFLLGFIGGLVALVTPCVWPIIPMTVSFFLKRSGDKRRGIRDAWIYGVSIVVIYLTLGLVVTALFGASALNNLATNAVFNIFFFLMLVVFAISFFGAFELTLPSSWSNAVDSKAEKKGGLLGIFLMAFTLTLVSFSCTGPIIGFLLVEVSTVGSSIVAPAIGMLGFAIALALPFTLFALFPSWLKSIPRSGGWMNTVKVVLGFIELAFALKFLSVADLAYGWHILDRETFLALWIAIFAVLALYLFGKIRLPHDDDEPRIGVTRLMLGLASLAFAIYMIPGLWGAPLKAVSAFAPPMKTQDLNLNPDAEVRPQFSDFDEGMAYASKNHLPVMIDFTGYGCVNCRKMEADVWTDHDVADKINSEYVLIQLYVDDRTDLPEPYVIDTPDGQRKLRTVGDKWSYLQNYKFGASTQPFYVLLDNDALPLVAPRSYDTDIDAYLKFLDEGLAEFKNRR